MGRNYTVFITPAELAEVVSAVCAANDWSLWLFPENNAIGEVIEVDGFESEQSRRMVWLGRLPAGRTTWTSRRAGLEAGFACLVRPTLVTDDSTDQLTVAEVFDHGDLGHGRRSPFPVMKASLERLSVGRVSACGDHSGVSRPTTIRCTPGALALWRHGVMLRQVVGGRVHFVPVGG